MIIIKIEKLENIKNFVDKNKLIELSVLIGNLGESSLNIKVEVSFNFSLNIIIKGSESFKDSGKDNLVFNRFDVKEVIKMIENRNELLLKSVIEIGFLK